MHGQAIRSCDKSDDPLTPDSSSGVLFGGLSVSVRHPTGSQGTTRKGTAAHHLSDPMYRTIDTKFWTDQKVRVLSADQKLLLLYCITNPLTHVSGLYRLPLVLIKHEIGFDEARLLPALKGLEALVKYDTENEVVWIVNMLKYQGRGQQIRRSVENHLPSLHDSPLVEKFVTHYVDWGIRYRIKGVLIPQSSKPSPVPVLSIKKEGGLGEENGFSSFWEAYPRKIGKGACEQWWRTNNPDASLLHLMLKSVEVAKRSQQWQKDKGQFIPHPMTWLNQKRWLDDYTTESKGKSPSVSKLEAMLE